MAQTGAEFFNFPSVDIAVFLSRVKEEFEDDIKAQEAYEKAMEGVQTEEEKKAIEKKIGKKRIPYPMLMLGKAGIGKTQGIADLCSTNNWGYKEMRLVNFTETDLIGIPYKDEHGMTQYATNALFPNIERGDPKHGIILVDEFTSAPSNIQVPILQLTDSSRSIGNYRLPDGWKIVLAGNGPGDGGTFRSLPGTVISRASCFYVETSLEAWMMYAMTHGIHKSIRAFQGAHTTGEYLHQYKEDEETGYEKAFPCPRTWEKLSRFLYDLDVRRPNWHLCNDNDADINLGDRIYIECLIASCIGTTAAQEFLSFVVNEKDIVSAEAICKSNTEQDRARLPKFGAMKNESKYLTVCSLADYLAANAENALDIQTLAVSQKYMQMFSNACNWILEGASSTTSEDAVFAINDILRRTSSIASSLVQDAAFLNTYCPKFKDVDTQAALLSM